MSLEELIYDALSQPVPVIGYYLSRRLSALYPNKAIFEGSTPAFNVEPYAQAGLCTLDERTVPHSRRIVYWLDREQGHVDRPQESFFDIRWQGERLHVLIVHWQDGMGHPYHYCIVANSREVAEHFHAAVCEWNTLEPEDYILVFDVHGWAKDEALLTAIKNATLENLVLRGTLKGDIVNDLTTFFAAQETYAEYGVPWKRGILFVGPAGNGKTHAVKALLNAFGQRCLYVKTFGGGGPDQADGFSFAYLKELFLSAMMRWIATPQEGAMDRIMADQASVLREQMASIEELPSDPGYAVQSDSYPPHFSYARRGHHGPKMPFQPGPGDVPM